MGLSFAPFYLDDQQEMVTTSITKTPKGYHGLSNICLEMEAKKLLTYMPNKLTFVRCTFQAGKDHILNIKLNNDDLIIARLDVLEKTLTEKGYKVDRYNYPGYLWSSNIESAAEPNAFIDSVIISGKPIEFARIGAELNVGELRSLCFSFE